MKRMIILMLLFSMAVFPFAVTAEEAQDTAIQGTGEASVTLFDVRYYFEHRLLPQAFYQEPEELMESLREGGLYDRWSRYTAERSFDVTYPADAFSVREMMQDSGLRMLMLTMPQPEKTLLCYRIYLCFDPETGPAAYYTAEYDVYEGFFDEGCLICGWKPDRTHQYFMETQILPAEDDPEYEKKLAEEAAAILNLMREQIETDHPKPLIQLT